MSTTTPLKYHLQHADAVFTPYFSTKHTTEKGAKTCHKPTKSDYNQVAKKVQRTEAIN